MSTQIIEDTGDTGDTINIQLATVNFQLSIIPNPANGDVTISVANISGTIHIEILDLRGREVKSVALDCTPNCEKTIDINSLTAGTYIVRITSGDITPIVRKLIVR